MRGHKSKAAVGIVVLARAGSRRLPGKVLLPFGAGNVLSSTLQRLRGCRRGTELVLATTEAPEDDAVARTGERLGVKVVRGSETDVVGRMLQAVAALSRRPDVVVRACADNPLVMPTVVDAGVRELIDTRSDVITPFEHATYPFGYGLVSMTLDCLERIDRHATDATYREHVENYCFEHPADFRVRLQAAPLELDYPELCTTLDYGLDYARLLRLGDALTGVPLADQPAALLAHLRRARVWFEGSHEHTRIAPSRCDLIVTTDAELARRHAAQAGLGALLVDHFYVGSSEHYGLRYVRGGGAFPAGPVFLDARPRTARDTPIAFLERARERVLPLLLAGPVRPLELQEAAAPTASKSVHAERRAGFAMPEHAAFPPRVAIELADDLSGAPLIEALLAELEREPGAELIVRGKGGARAESLVAAAIERLGEERVRRSDERDTPADSTATRPGDPFRELSIDRDGRLTAAGVTSARDLARCTISNHWTSPAVRRARVDALNSGARGSGG